MKPTINRAAGVASAVVLAATLAACASSDDAGASDTTGSGTAGPDEPGTEPGAEAVQIRFWGWAPGYAGAVAGFNDAQDRITVEYEEIPPGAQGGYEQMLNAVTAGNAPCLAQVGYETLTSFVAAGALEDVSDVAGADAGDFVPWTWSAVGIGDAVYGAPVDQGPMAMFYRTDVFEDLDIAVPETWAEYAEAAERINEADPDAYISAPYQNYDYAGFAWQAGAPWFAIDGDSWRVSVDSPENAQVGEFWQGLADDGLLSPATMYDQSWYQGLGDGSIATVVGAVWQAGVIKGNAAAGAGDWAVAPMPQWNEGETAAGNVGGSATAVLSGCDDPAAAWEFAHWMSTDADAYTGLIEEAALYPAASALLDLPVLSEADPYFGDQPIFDVFAQASPNVDTDWTWGPVMTKTAADLDDGLGRAYSGESTIPDALQSTADATVAEMEQQGLSVTR